MCVCFRSWSCLHCLSKGSESDASGSSLGNTLLLHAAAVGTGQPGEGPPSHSTAQKVILALISVVIVELAVSLDLT